MIFLEQSKIITNNQKHFIDLMTFATTKIERLFNSKDYTYNYSRYNIFSLTAPDELMYFLFQELKQNVRNHLGDKPLWMQSWLNFHKSNQVLDWHNHLWKWHGYITIDPKNTQTIFENYTIDNKVGQIYFGEGGLSHKVQVISPYEGYRITLGFDITDGIPQENYLNSLILF
jgi:hypothetical protein